MAKKIKNKIEKPVIVEKPVKVEQPKESNVRVIDWNALPAQVVIVAVGGKHMEIGKEYKIGKEQAKLLVDKGIAKIK